VEKIDDSAAHCCVCFVPAVIVWTFLDPRPSPTALKPEDPAVAKEKEQMMATIALSFF
jgi:hypothetical protein